MSSTQKEENSLNDRLQYSIENFERNIVRYQGRVSCDQQPEDTVLAKLNNRQSPDVKLSFKRELTRESESFENSANILKYSSSGEKKYNKWLTDRAKITPYNNSNQLQRQMQTTPESQKIQVNDENTVTLGKIPYERRTKSQLLSGIKTQVYTPTLESIKKSKDVLDSSIYVDQKLRKQLMQISNTIKQNNYLNEDEENFQKNQTQIQREKQFEQALDKCRVNKNPVTSLNERNKITPRYTQTSKTPVKAIYQNKIFHKSKSIPDINIQESPSFKDDEKSNKGHKNILKPPNYQSYRNNEQPKNLPKYFTGKSEKIENKSLVHTKPTINMLNQLQKQVKHQTINSDIADDKSLRSQFTQATQPLFQKNYDKNSVVNVTQQINKPSPNNKNRLVNQTVFDLSNHYLDHNNSQLNCSNNARKLNTNSNSNTYQHQKLSIAKLNIDFTTGKIGLKFGPKTKFSKKSELFDQRRAIETRQTFTTHQYPCNTMESIPADMMSINRNFCDETHPEKQYLGSVNSCQNCCPKIKNNDFSQDFGCKNQDKEGFRLNDYCFKKLSSSKRKNTRRLSTRSKLFKTLITNQSGLQHNSSLVDFHKASDIRLASPDNQKSLMSRENHFIFDTRSKKSLKQQKYLLKENTDTFNIFNRNRTAQLNDSSYNNGYTEIKAKEQREQNCYEFQKEEDTLVKKTFAMMNKTVFGVRRQSLGSEKLIRVAQNKENLKVADAIRFR